MEKIHSKIATYISSPFHYCSYLQRYCQCVHLRTVCTMQGFAGHVYNFIARSFISSCLPFLPLCCQISEISFFMFFSCSDDTAFLASNTFFSFLFKNRISQPQRRLKRSSPCECSPNLQSDGLFLLQIICFFPLLSWSCAVQLENGLNASISNAGGPLQFLFRS